MTAPTEIRQRAIAQGAVAKPIALVEKLPAETLTMAGLHPPGNKEPTTL